MKCVSYYGIKPATYGLFIYLSFEYHTQSDHQHVFLGCIATSALTIIFKYDVLLYLHSPFFVIHIVL